MTFDRTIPAGLEDAILEVLAACNYRREAALSRSSLVLAASAKMGEDIPDRVIRLAIHSLRRKGVLICSAPGADGGYWLASDWQDVSEFFERELHPKAMDLLETESAMKEAARRKFGDAVQVSLF
jgi:hypothetical protein